jgi:hypothetical protein
MDSPGMPHVMFVDDHQKHSTIDTLNALQNLLYLIRLDATYPDRILAYVAESDTLLPKLQRQMLPE